MIGSCLNPELDNILMLSSDALSMDCFMYYLKRDFKISAYYQGKKIYTQLLSKNKIEMDIANYVFIILRASFFGYHPVEKLR